MYYVCIENNSIASVLNYYPNVTEGINVVEITSEEYGKVNSGTHFFDVQSLKVIPQTQEMLNVRLQILSNADFLKYLKETDWMILRHLREKTLGLETSLTEDKYIELEQKRQEAANRINV